MDIKEWTSLPLPELLTMAACRGKKTGTGPVLNRSSCPPDDKPQAAVSRLKEEIRKTDNEAWNLGT